MPALNLGNIENVVDDVQQVAGSVMNEFCVLHDLGTGDRTLVVLADNFREPDDGVERSSQLMAHIGDELALDAIGELRFDPGGVFRLPGTLAQDGLADERSIFPHERNAARPPDGISDHFYTDRYKIGLKPIPQLIRRG